MVVNFGEQALVLAQQLVAVGYYVGVKIHTAAWLFAAQTVKQGGKGSAGYNRIGLHEKTSLAVFGL